MDFPGIVNYRTRTGQSWWFKFKAIDRTFLRKHEGVRI